MTREEAIECIEAIHVQMFNSGNSKWTEACDMAIEALKEPKQEELTLEKAIDFLTEIGWLPEHDRILTERPHGEWIKTDNRWGLGEYECSACRSYLDIPTQMGEPMFKWCPYCGARMKEGEAE